MPCCVPCPRGFPALGGKVEIISPIEPPVKVNFELRMDILWELVSPRTGVSLPIVLRSPTNILAVRPVDKTSCNRVARSRRSGKLVRLPRDCPSAIASISKGGGRGLSLPEELVAALGTAGDSVLGSTAVGPDLFDPPDELLLSIEETGDFARGNRLGEPIRRGG